MATSTKTAKLISGKAKRLWAAVNHSPSQVYDLMQNLNTSVFGGKLRTQIIYDSQIKKSEFDESAHVWIVVSAFALELLCQKKIDMTKATIILIENCAVATQYKGIVLLDSDQVKSYHFKFKPLDSNLVLSIRNSKDTELVDIERCKVDIIPTLLGAMPPSALAPIMTFAYTVDATRRSRYILDIFDVIRGEKSLTDVSWYNASNKRMVALSEWIDSAEGRLITKSLCDALAKTKPSDTALEFRQLAEEHGIDKFDINYAVEFFKRNSKVSFPELDTSEMFALDENRQLAEESY